jgi:tRNA dimethylallyltransferase
MRAIGYRHLQPVVEGRDTLANVLVAMQRDTRQFARRQRTWLRRVAGVEWLDPERRETIERRVADFLGRAQPPVV